MSDTAASRLTLGPRPKVKAAAMLAQGVDAVGCCLLPQEHPKDLLAAYGKKAVHMPFTVYGLNAPPQQVAVRTARLARILRDGGRVHVHCAAGLHRTGAVGYAILRMNGYSTDDALAEIERIRPITHHNLTVKFRGLVPYADRYLTGVLL